MNSETDRVPFGVYLLATGIFCLGTSEFMIAGLLPQISSALEVNIPTAGLLISGFAVGMAVGAPLMAVATLRLPVKATLVSAALLFALGHVLAAVTDQFALVMLSRVASAVMCGGFWAVASVMAVRLSPHAVVGRSLAALVGGLTISNLLGVTVGPGWENSSAGVRRSGR